MTSNGMTESRFYMWRSIFALAHADHVVTPEERRFMFDALASQDFSEDQRAILKDDIEHKKDIGEMFSRVVTEDDRSGFFYYARLLCWSDGDFDEQEQKIVLELKKAHVKNVDVSALVGSVQSLSFEEEECLRQDVACLQNANDTAGVLKSFLSRFSKK